MSAPKETVFEIPSADAFALSPGTMFCTKGKTVFDITVASLLLALVWPLMLVITLLIKCDSKGAVLFSQERLGKQGKPFIIYKFRTMTKAACESGDVTQASGYDPRVTRIGRFLRRTSLDELPQLWNVLRGDMSLIGPRPHAVAHDMYFSDHIDGYWRRYAVKPGVTGWAQINGLRGETPAIVTMAARIEKDLEYIALRTWIMDIKIALKTAYLMLFPARRIH